MQKVHKVLKRTAAAVLSLAMASTVLATGAFAEDGKASITISKPAGVTGTTLEGLQAKAYLVLDRVNDKDEDPEKWKYTVTHDFDAFFDVDLSETDSGTQDVDDVFASEEGKDTVYLTYEGNKLVAHTDTTGISVPYITLEGGPLDDTYPEADLVSRVQSNADGSLVDNGDVATFYSWIEAYIGYNSSINFTAQSAEGDANADKLEISPLDEGYYALLFSYPNKPNEDPESVTNGLNLQQGMLVETTEETPVTLKAEEIPLDKTVKNASSNTAAGDETTAQVGDVLTYTINSRIPNPTDESYLTEFGMADTLENQQFVTAENNKPSLTFTNTELSNTPKSTTFAWNQDSTSEGTFKIGNKIIATLTVGEYGDVDDPNNPGTKIKGQNLTLTFDVDELKAQDLLGWKVAFEYKATLTADAQQMNENDVTLTYDNNDTTHELTDKTKVYTYGIQVQKTFAGATTGSLPYNQVKFTLYPDSGTGTQGTTAIQLYEVDTGVYTTTPVPQSQTPTTELGLDSQGKLTIKGLDAKVYWLEETTVPTGYRAAEPIKVTLVAEKDSSGLLTGILDGSTTALYNGTGTTPGANVITDSAITNISLAKFDVLNRKGGFTLPQTGGAGTWMFTIGGILLIALAVVLLTKSKKKNNE